MRTTTAVAEIINPDGTKEILVASSGKNAELDLMMNAPNKITVHVTSAEEPDLSGIIVETVVTTGQKNPYLIHFPKTDTAGTATLTSEDLIGQFRDHWESGLMDHAGTLASADPRVRVSLYDPS